MNELFLVTGVLAGSGAVAHGYLGERLVLMPVTQGTDLPSTRFGDGTQTAMMLRFTWHFFTVVMVSLAVAVMNFLVEPHASGRGTRLFTETRVRCLGRSSRRWFRLYWLVIRPFSGLLRRAMLSGIRARAISKMPEAPLTIGESRGNRSV